MQVSVKIIRAALPGGTVEPVRMLTYKYAVGKDFGFAFHLLCEVGEPWQAQAKQAQADLCARTNSHVVTVELQEKPYLVDALVKNAA